MVLAVKSGQATQRIGIEIRRNPLMESHSESASARPKFPESELRFEVFENALPDQLIGVVHASLPNPSFGQVKYSMFSDAKADAQFEIHPQLGEIRLKKVLDFESAPQQFELKIGASSDSDTEPEWLQVHVDVMDV